MDGRNINISAGRACFVKCSGCYNHFGSSEELVSSDQLIAFLTAAKNHGINRVTLCGGDPLSRPDILTLLGDIKSLNLSVSLDTVGTPLLSDVETIFFGRNRVSKIDAKALIEHVDIIGIPLDGASESIFAEFRRGRPHLLREQLAILKILCDLGAKVCVNTVAHSRNLAGIPRILDMISGFACIALWQVFQFMPSGPLAYRNRHRFEITDEEFKDLERRIRQREKSFTGRIEFKSNAYRKNRYLLVDANGFAWLPSYKESPMWINEDASEQRVIVGDIRDPNNHSKILSYVESPNAI